MTPAARPYARGQTRTHVLERPPVAVPQPGHAQLASRPRSPRLKKRDAESFRARRFSKGRSHVKEPGGEGEAGAAPRLWANAGEVRTQTDPRPKGSEVSPSRARGLQIPRAKGFSQHPGLTANRGRGA